MAKKREIVGILGSGEVGSAMARLCKEAGYRVFIRELKYDHLGGRKIDILHVNIPEIEEEEFIKIVVGAVKELKPKLTIINSSIVPGTTRKIFYKTKLPIVHSPVIGIHPHIYESVKKHFPKIIGPVSKESGKLAKKHLKKLGLKVEVYDRAEESEAAKSMDLAYYAWNIIYNKWAKEMCEKEGWNFDQVYTKHNEIYNAGYKKLMPNVVRPILIPRKGVIGGHCIVPVTELFNKSFNDLLTEFILKENARYAKQKVNGKKERKEFVSVRDKFMKKK